MDNPRFHALLNAGYHQCPDGAWRRTPSNGMFDGLCNICEYYASLSAAEADAKAAAEADAFAALPRPAAELMRTLESSPRAYAIELYASLTDVERGQLIGYVAAFGDCTAVDAVRFLNKAFKGE